MRKTVVVAMTLAMLAGMAMRSDAQTLAATGGIAWCRMQPRYPEARSDFEFSSRRAATLGLRGELPLRKDLFLAADVRWAPRGGAVSFRSTTRYYGDYLELSARLGWRSPGTVSVAATAGPALAVRLRQRTDWTVQELTTTGKLTAAELSGLVTVGVAYRTTRSVLGVEAQYLYGLTNVHEPGDAGTVHDPHVYDFEGKSRVFSVVLVAGITRAR